MSRIYENSNQATYERICDLRELAQETNKLLKQIIEILRRNEQNANDGAK